MAAYIQVWDPNDQYLCLSTACFQVYEGMLMIISRPAPVGEMLQRTLSMVQLAVSRVYPVILTLLNTIMTILITWDNQN